METPLMHEYRADVIECIHSGHIVIVNDQGLVKAWAGDPKHIAFTRSSAKPIQAIPAVRGGIMEHYSLTEKELAVMVSSHRGEPEHQSVLKALMQKTGIHESSLVCGKSYPLDENSREDLLRHGGEKRKIHHNCAGKHLGMLAYSKMRGIPLEGYDSLGHPVQQEVLAVMSGLSGMPRENLITGIDGCGLPVFALPLHLLAAVYMKLACPDLIRDESIRDAVRKITGAMNRHPHLVGGKGRVDTLLLQDENIVAKGGFKGIFGLALKKERLGIVFKVLDGSEEEWAYITASILEQIGYSNKRLIESLREAYSSDLYNDSGQKVGSVKTVFTLDKTTTTV
ncbi:asparaginase [Paenibacillus lemnae]|uniref:Asparaginase n=1 Tax=Paenibacillus lemnae TaxID=1330551 RepID=A0A848MAR5_PAELE|nr:asparaginase [Paenibacillus lemnae]NMO97291.1 asparaginase [Paenibacillus lemnae]